jgi:Fe-S cluster assembly protein SufD
VGEGAEVNHAFRSKDQGNSVLTFETQLAARARSTTVGHVRGTGKTRLQAGTILAGTEAEARLATLMQLGGQAHGDLHSVFRHDHADTRAHQLAKNLLDGEAKAIFTGRVHIARHAQRVDARQMNRNLLLSKKAWAVGQPQLEIFADDVKCGHGSSTGQIGDDETFYLLSRGIPADKARALLTRAFVAEVFYQAPGSLRERLEAP